MWVILSLKNLSHSKITQPRTMYRSKMYNFFFFFNFYKSIVGGGGNEKAMLGQGDMSPLTLIPALYMLLAISKWIVFYKYLKLCSQNISKS